MRLSNFASKINFNSASHVVALFSICAYIARQCSLVTGMDCAFSVPGVIRGYHACLPANGHHSLGKRLLWPENQAINTTAMP